MEQLNSRNITSLLRNALLLLAVVSEVVFATSFNDSVLVGGTGPADSKAQLDVKSTSKGVLLPRMTTTQQNAITSPTEGLLIYDNVLHQLSNYNGTAWTAVGGTPNAATTSTLGTVKALTAISHQFLTGITTGTGVPTQAQPTCADLSGVATSCSTDTTNASNISSGTLGAGRLPNPSASTLGGIQSALPVTNQWINSISILGVPSLSQPAFSNLSGNISTSQMNSGTSASSSTFWRGDGTWAVAGGTITGPGSSTNTAFARWNGTGGTAIQDSVFLGASTGILTSTGDTTGHTFVSVTDTTSSASVGIDHTSTSLLLKTLESSTNAGYSIGLSTASIAGANANATGAISLTTGDKSAGTGNSGAITITTGATTAGTRGRISLADGSEVNSPGSVWTISGNSGSGHWVNPSDSKNYIANPDANIQSSSTTPAGWANYFDAAGTAPVDCTGGAPVTALTRNTTTPIGPGTDFRWTKSAVSRQGEGFSYDFSIEKTDQAKVMKLGFDYSVASGTFVAGSPGVDSDMTVWIYDITNAVLIQPSTYKLFSSTTSPPAAFDSTFQTASNSTSYRLCVHTGTTSASAYTLAFRNFEAKRARYTYGSSTTDWVPYTPTFANLGSVTAINVRSRRVGDSLEVQGNFTTGTVGAGTASMTLGYNGVSGNVTASSVFPAAGTVVGHMNLNNQSTVNFSGLSVIATPSVTTVGFGAETSTTNGYTQATGTNMGNTGTYSFFITGIPITGWTSTVQMSDSAPQTVVAFRSTSQPTGTVNSSVNIATFLTPQSDTVGGYSSGTYTAKVQGSYNISAALEVDGTFTVGQNAIIYLYKNGSEIARASALAGGSVAALFPALAVNGIDLIAGDALTIRTSTTAGGSPSYGGSNCFFSLVKAGDPRTIGATESVGAYYTGAPPTGTLAAAFNTTTFGTKVNDSHSAYSAGTYTVPVSGRYSISAGVAINATYAINKFADLSIFVNGVSKIEGVQVASAAITVLYPNVNTHDLQLSAGDLVTIRAYDDATTPTYGSIASSNYFSIVRTGM